MFASEATRPRVLGIDPGLTRCGFAVLEVAPGGRGRALSIGVMRTATSLPLERRLGQIHEDLEELLAEFGPSTVAVERIFFQSNSRTAMSVAHVSGIVMALAARRGLAVVEYTPSQVKNAVAGWGGADKQQMQDMVRTRLSLAEAPSPADAADAAAVALCHIAMMPFASKVQAAMAAEAGR